MPLTGEAKAKLKLVLLVHRLRRKRRRTMYIREIFEQRPHLGEYHLLVQELRRVDPEYYFKYFRMTKASFDRLLQLVYHRILHPPNHRRPISPGERLAVTLRFLATSCSMQDIAMSYCMHTSTVQQILKETLPAIWDCLSPLVLRRPTTAEWEKIRQAYSSKWDFPNCVGSIDGKHFAIKCPDNSGSDFHNYKGFFSVVLLAVVDADYHFLLVDTGAEGRFPDGFIFKESIIKEQIEDGTLGLPLSATTWPPCIVGDAAFPLKTYLMRPYPGKNLEEKKKVFNYRLSRARRCVENAFGILVSRWRSFLGTVEGDPELLTNMVNAAVCLHNFLMLDDAYCPAGYSDNVNGENVQEGNWRQTVMEVSGSSRCLTAASNRSTTTALALRDEIADYFMSAAGSLLWQLNVVRRS